MTGNKTKYVGFWIDKKYHDMLKEFAYELNAKAKPDIPMTPSGFAKILFIREIEDYVSKDPLERIKF